MVKLFLLISAFYSHSLWAISFSFYDGCHTRPLILGTKTINTFARTVGDVTIEILNKYRIPYVGSESGLNSLFNSPMGLDALEALSDIKLRAYGPCYILDGKILENSPDKVKFASQSSKLIWYIGYSIYDSGVWEGYCIPSYKLRSKFICGKMTAL